MLKDLDGDETGNFYLAEPDQFGNQFSWSRADALLNFNLAAPHGFELTIEGRSAAVFGGPDSPVMVHINDRPIGELHFDPANPNFQKVSLAYTGTILEDQILKIEILAQPYQPKGDPRTLGFMVQSIQLVNLGWSSQPLRLNFLAGVMVVLLILTAWLGWWNRQRKLRWAGSILVGLDILGSGTALVMTFLLDRYASWLTGSDSFLIWSFGLGILAIVFWQAAATQPFGRTGNSLYRRAFSLVNPDRRNAGAAIPFKGVASIEALTGLRAIAAFMVFIYHYPLAADSFLPQWLYSFTRSGNNGVPLFFTLSGFVICYNYYDRLTTRPFKNLWPFLVNRVARLYPVYLLVLLVALAITLNTRPERISSTVFWQQATMLQTWNPDVRILSALIYNVPSWSVNVEIFLYVSFPLITWFVLKRFQQVWQLIAVAAVAMLAVLGLATGFVLTGHTSPADYGVDSPGLYIFFYFPVTHLSEFISGCAAARIYTLLADKPVTARELAWGKVALFLAIAAVVFLMIFDAPYLTPFQFASGYVPFFTIIVFCLARYRTLLSRLLSSKLLILLGEASYSFYMWHEVILVSNLDRLTKTPEPWTYLIGFGLFLVVVMVSIASFKLVEIPTRKLIRRVALPHRPVTEPDPAREVSRVESKVKGLTSN